MPVQTTDSNYIISVSHQDAAWLDRSVRASFKSDTACKCLLTRPTGVRVPEVWLEAPVSGTYNPYPSPDPHSLRSVNTRAAKAAPGLEVTVAAAAVRAHEGTVLTVSAITALSLAPWYQERRSELKYKSKAYRAHCAGTACLGRSKHWAAHRSPIQPALQRVHLPVTWLQACPSRQGGQRWPQPSP